MAMRQRMRRASDHGNRQQENQVMTTEALHQLPNGDWITLSRVTEIITLDAENGYQGTTHPPRVTVMWGARYTALQFDSFGAAADYRDELARQVNEARSAITAPDNKKPPAP
jgi:hypothetical protein